MQLIGVNVKESLQASDVNYDILYEKGSFLVAEVDSYKFELLSDNGWFTVDPESNIEGDGVISAELNGELLKVYVEAEFLRELEDYYEEEDEYEEDDESDILKFSSFESYCEDVYGASTPNNLASIAGSIASLNGITIAELIEKTSKESFYFK